MELNTDSYKGYKYDPCILGCHAGWRRYEKNPVVTSIGHCYDLSVVRVDSKFKMYFSWGSTRSIAYLESDDGFKWTREPVVVLEARPESKWEDDVNRVCVIYHDGLYKMWYSAQALGTLESGFGESCIGYAESKDGKHFKQFDNPVLKQDAEWENNGLMCPHINWDEEEQIYKMWYTDCQFFEPNTFGYAASGQFVEPTAIGYATSKDGINWEKYNNNPIFTPIADNRWEMERVGACQVIKMDGWYYMFYIGFQDVHSARICFARSRNGISDWERHKDNPIISGTNMGWDSDGAYKPELYYDNDKDRWILWYNGRCGHLEHIGVATHEGKDFGF